MGLVGGVTACNEGAGFRATVKVLKSCGYEIDPEYVYENVSFEFEKL